MSVPWLLVGVGALGVGVLYVRKRQADAAAAAAAPTGTESACALAAKAAAAAGLPFSDAACQGVVGVLGEVADAAFYSDADRIADLKSADEKNKALNGEVELANSYVVKSNYDGAQAYGTELAGSVLRFKSGCAPFRGAPGWEKCAPGTVDMWGYVGNVNAAVVTLPARAPNAPAFTVDDLKTASPADLFSGSTRPASVDASTKGPLPYRADDGSIVNRYAVRGVPIDCPQGQAPGLWDALGNPIGDNRTPVCVPNGVSTYQATWTNNTAPVECGAVRWTWNEATSAWVQTTVPCAPTAPVVAPISPATAGTLAITSDRRTSL